MPRRAPCGRPDFPARVVGAPGRDGEERFDPCPQFVGDDPRRLLTRPHIVTLYRVRTWSELLVCGSVDSAGYPRDLALGDGSPLTGRGYAFGLLRWFRLLLRTNWWRRPGPLVLQG